MRLDEKVVEIQKCSKTYAQNLIREGKVFLNGKIVTKNGFQVSDEKIEILDDNSYVSRSALKLIDAFHNFNASVENNVCVDIGASTGGFTQVLLEKNAIKVYSIDVGINQLHEKIRNHPKVRVMEKINCRYIEESMFDEKFEFVVMDVSFISIELIIPALLQCCKENVEMIILVKPQFEVGNKYINKHGIVKDEKIVAKMLELKKQFFSQNKLKVLNMKKCSVVGKDGNQEYLFHLKRGCE